MKNITITILAVLALMSCTPEESPCFECEVVENSNGETNANCWQIECTNE